MILDASAIVALALDEPERAELTDRIDGAAVVAVGAPTLVEVGLVLGARLQGETTAWITEMLRTSDVTVIAFGDDHWREALRAWDTYGKGRHRARLNFGDCLAYATARVARRPLLAKGDDFRHTDIELVPLEPVR
ncbi:MAG: type II toxin-antitoxin system VapC family toxin [Chloroflexi bacterium]|nr:type II toxin-antitoxin system VapC family toxin [Chloroflexota bacterium]